MKMKFEDSNILKSMSLDGYLVSDFQTDDYKYKIRKWSKSIKV